MAAVSPLQLHSPSGVYSENDPSSNALPPEGSGFKRKLSKREKKEKKKHDKEAKLHGKENETPRANGVAQKLYSELPETSFTRSISNPEAVMKRRRQMKLEKKLQQFKSRDGGPDTGGYTAIAYRASVFPRPQNFRVRGIFVLLIFLVGTWLGSSHIKLWHGKIQVGGERERERQKKRYVTSND